MLSADSIAALAADHPTPLMLIDLAEVRRAAARFADAFPGVEVFYSTKTNPDPGVVDTMLASGAGFDAATVAEILYLVADCGADPAKIVYTHPVKSVAEIERAAELGVGWMTADSVRETEKIARHAPDARILIRIEADARGGMYDYRHRLGASPEGAAALVAEAVRRGWPVAGVSFHVGSQTTAPDAWERALARVEQLVRRHPQLEVVNLGSGFPARYRGGSGLELSAVAPGIHEALARMGAKRVFAEPGRVIVADAGMLLTTVVDVARGWVFTDASVYNGLIEILESGGRLTYEIECLSQTGPTRPYSVAGKTLDPDDIIARDVALPADLAAGDTLAIMSTGAYSVPFFSRYHQLDAPTVLYVDSHDDANVLIGSSGAAGRGVLARRAFAPGERVFTVTGTRTAVRTRESIQIGWDRHLDPSVFGRYLNHSCAPNAGIRSIPGGHDVVASRPIAPGEHVTVHYAMFEYELGPAAAIDCRCGASECDGAIPGYRDTTPAWRARFADSTASYLVGAGLPIAA